MATSSSTTALVPEASPTPVAYHFDCGFDWDAQQQQPSGIYLPAVVCVQKNPEASLGDFCTLIESVPVTVRIYDITDWGTREPTSYTFYVPTIRFVPANTNSKGTVRFMQLETPPKIPTPRLSVAFGKQYNSWDAGPITLDKGHFQMTVEFTIHGNGTQKTFRRDPEVIIGNG